MVVTQENAYRTVDACYGLHVAIDPERRNGTAFERSKRSQSLHLLVHVFFPRRHRLHKPVRIIHESNQTVPLIAENLVFALKAALLLLPESFTCQELYSAIAGLSYTGNARWK